VPFLPKLIYIERTLGSSASFDEPAAAAPTSARFAPSSNVQGRKSRYRSADRC